MMYTTVIVGIKFLFDFLSPKPGKYVVKAVRINSPKCSFFRVPRWFDCTNFITEKKIHSSVVLYTEMSYTPVF